MKPQQHASNTCSEILIVEDSPTQAELLKTILEEHGYHVRVARNGEEALTALKQAAPTLVISDINMPGMDGYTLCSRIRSDSGLKGMPVILLTSLSDPKDVLKGLECGADNFITKPYDKKQLLSRIQNICSSLELRKSERMQMGVEVFFGGQRHFITSDRQQILDLLLATYEEAVQVNAQLKKTQEELKHLNRDLERKVAERTATLEEELAERKRAEERIREQAELLDKAQDAIYVTGIDGHISYWNKSAERLYGWTAQEAVGKNTSKLLSETSPEASASEEIVKGGIQSTGEWIGELRHLTKDGQQVLVQCRLTLVRDAAGNRKSLLHINTDITERRQLEIQLSRAQRLESIGTLASGIAHDLNNALAPVLMATEMLRVELVGESVHKFLDCIQNSALRGADMVKQILAFARGVEGRFQSLSLKHLTNDAVNLCKATFPPSIRIVTIMPEDLWPVVGDATQINQLLTNLCVNARDAMPQGGELRLEENNLVLDHKQTSMQPSPLSGPFVSLAVADTGTGIPSHLLGKIFEPFFTTKGTGKGTGLGLATVSQIVRQHGGFLEVASEYGKGTLFTVYLPASPNVKPNRVEEKAPALLVGQGQQILLVDDEKALLEMAKNVLESLNYRVIAAHNGAEASILYRQNSDKIHLVLTDGMMPIMDGPDLIREIRAINAGVKVICMTGIASKDKFSALESLNPEAILHKPYTSEQLATTIHQVLAH